ncbi:MAG: putative NEK protein kinase, partial [Streblomastix strix]
HVWELFAQIILALNHLHTHDVIHRDIKPENIFIMEDGTARLGDFGLAKDLIGTYNATVAGTKFYMAPEVFLQKKMDFSADVYAVGVVIFELLTGKHPFLMETELATIEKIVQGKPNELPDDIIDELSSGAFGRILVMKLKTTGHVYVIKRLPYLRTSSKKMADEEIAMMKLTHSKYTQSVIETFPYDLDICLKSLKYMYQILQGIQHLQSLGIIHRDLKPENILIDKSGNIKLADFGLASKMSSRSYLYAAGTQNYSPPEAHTENRYTPESDIWAAGIIIIELITGVHPFEGMNQDKTIENIIRGNMKPLPEYIQDELKKILLDMVNQRWNSRPSAKQILDTLLMQLQADIENFNLGKANK